MPQAEGVHFQRVPGLVVWFSAFAAAGGIKNCGGAATTTLGAEGPVKPKNPPADGRSILRTLFHNPSTQPAAIRRPQPSGQRPVNPHTEGVSKARKAAP